MNTASCSPVLGNYTCECLKGFTAELCEIAIDACQNSHCINNGTCISLSMAECSCLCEDPYEGFQCQFLKDPCIFQPCNHSGYSEAIDHESFICHCENRYGGLYCNNFIASNSSIVASDDETVNVLPKYLGCVGAIILLTILAALLFMLRRR